MLPLPLQAAPNAMAVDKGGNCSKRCKAPTAPRHSRASRPGQAARHAQARVRTHERRERDGGRAAGLSSRQRARQRRLAQQPQHARSRRACAPARPARPHLRLCLRAQAARVTRDGSPGSTLSIAACSGTAGARSEQQYTGGRVCILRPGEHASVFCMDRDLPYPYQDGCSPGTW